MALFTCHVSILLAEIWVAKWSAADPDDQRRIKWIWMLIALSGTGIATSISSIMALFYLHVMGFSRLHERMMDHVTKAPLRFFHMNPSGRILNRFSKDINRQDEEFSYVAADDLSVSYS